jgi:hypothetical protein
VPSPHPSRPAHWNRAFRWVTTAALLAPAASHAVAFDTAGFIRGCTQSCEPQWRKGAMDPSSPAFRMTEKDVQGLCLCACETMVHNMSPELREAFKKAAKSGNRPTGELAKKAADNAMSAMAVCVPKYQHPAK